MIEKFDPKLLASTDGNPPLLTNERAYLECGCSAFIGLRVDNQQAALAAIACTDDHEDLMEAFIKAYHKSLEKPLDRPAVEVADEILEAQANRAVRLADK